jgi:hypothetical protein
MLLVDDLAGDVTQPQQYARIEWKECRFRQVLVIDQFEELFALCPQ